MEDRDKPGELENKTFNPNSINGKALSLIGEQLETNIKAYYSFPCQRHSGNPLSRTQIAVRRVIGDKIMQLQVSYYAIAGHFYEYKYHPVLNSQNGQRI